MMHLGIASDTEVNTGKMVMATMLRLLRFSKISGGIRS